MLPLQYSSSNFGLWRYKGTYSTCFIHTQNCSDRSQGHKKLTFWYIDYSNSQGYFPNGGKRFHSILYLDCRYRPPLCMVFWRQEHIPCLHILFHMISLSVSLFKVIFLLYPSPMSCHISSDIMAMISSALGFLFLWYLREDCFPHSCSPPVTLPTMFYFHLLVVVVFFLIGR